MLRQPQVFLPEVTRRCGAATAAIVSSISARLTPTANLVTRTLLLVLSEIAGGADFSSFFSPELSSRFIAVAGSSAFRASKSLDLAVATLVRLGDAMPDEALQLVMILLASRRAAVSLEKALRTACTLPLSRRESLFPFVERAFAQILPGPNREFDPSTPTIPEVLAAFPALVHSFRPSLVNLLRHCFANFAPKTIGLVAVLLGLLIPDRTRTESSRVLGEAEAECGNIPQAIFARAPDVWRVIADHWGLIGRLVRENCGLMRKELSFLTKYPELMDMGMKTGYFKMSQRGKLNTREILLVRVRRDKVLADSYANLRNQPASAFFRKISVVFQGEAGIDAGGLLREWFSLVVIELFNPGYGLFITSRNRRTFQPSPSSHVNQDHLSYLTFAGRIIARALVQGFPLDCHLSSGFLKQILGVVPALRDLEEFEEQLHRSLSWILETRLADLGDAWDMTFTIDFDHLGDHQTIELRPDGADLPVTDANKAEYVGMVVEYYLAGQIKDQVKAFCDGFYSLVPLDEIKVFTPSELDLLICGVPEINVQDLLENCVFDFPYHEHHPVVALFFNVITKWGNEKLAKLLIFVTGSSQVPLGGFASLKQTSNAITIGPGGSRERLPVGHTCVNKLDLPEYESEEELAGKLEFAIFECNSFSLF
jgi:E3 ubiquitin-protein ligase HUWE1